MTKPIPQQVLNSLGHIAQETGKELIKEPLKIAETIIFSIAIRSIAFSTTQITRLLNLLIAASKLEKEVAIDQLPLQLAVVEFCHTATPSGVEPKKGDQDKTDEPKKSTAKTVEPEKKDKKLSQPKNSPHPRLTVEMVAENWPKLLATVKPFNHSVEAFLRSARPKGIDEKGMVIEVFYPFHKDRLEETKNRKIVEDGIKQVFGEDLTLECCLAEIKASQEITVVAEEKPLTTDEKKVPESNSAGAVVADDIYQVAKEIFG